jgi:GT2 family glycosyltransferase
VAVVDVVVVSFNSCETLRTCVGHLARDSSYDVFVVDNASRDGSISSISDLPVSRVELDRNYGFAYACNRGSEAGASPYVLFVNPDARIEPDSILRLVSALDRDESAGAVAPRLSDARGRIEHSLRRFPRLRSTYSQALFLHRLLPRASWVDEVVREPYRYQAAGPTEWVSGACLLVRRKALEDIGGWDEAFFLYGEDVDLCRRLATAGHRILYEPQAVATHVGGVSAPRAQLLAQLVRGRLQFVKKHERPAVAFLHQAGLALGSLTHAALTTQGAAVRRGQLRAFQAAVRPSEARPLEPTGESESGALGGNRAAI